MNKYIKFFKGVPVPERTGEFSAKYIDQGVLVETSVMERYGTKQIEELVADITTSDAEMNKTFHKSWKKVRDATIEQLVAEQIVHYFSTYGLKSLGLYNDDTVYIPMEDSELYAKGGITFMVIKGITPKELEKRIESVLASGVALSEEDLEAITDMIDEVSMDVNIDLCANKEMTARLYKMMGKVPKNPMEFLRLKVFEITGSSLLIKNKEMVASLKNTQMDVFEDYKKAYGLIPLAQIFNRYKPIFLGLKNTNSRATVNKIAKLSKRYHKPMKEDYLNTVTKHLRNWTFDILKFEKALENANIFRKLKLYQALKFYGNKDINGVVYTVRNGKTYTTETEPVESTEDAKVLLRTSLKEDMKHLKDKKIYLDADLTVPTSGKMFYGDIPFGSSFSTTDGLTMGVCWTGSCNDLDLSVISVDGKTGWDGAYRNDDFLFSGDITSAPNGATEVFQVRKNANDGIYIMNLNLFSGDNSIPYTVFVGKVNEYDSMNRNAMLSKDNMLFHGEGEMTYDTRQKSIAILQIKNGVKTFYLYEGVSGKRVTSLANDKSALMIDYYTHSLDSMVKFRNFLPYIGAELVDNVEDADIDLSLNSISKDRILTLLTELPEEEEKIEIAKEKIVEPF